MICTGPFEVEFATGDLAERPGGCRGHRYALEGINYGAGADWGLQ